MGVSVHLLRVKSIARPSAFVMFFLSLALALSFSLCLFAEVERQTLTSSRSRNGDGMCVLQMSIRAACERSGGRKAQAACGRCTLAKKLHNHSTVEGPEVWTGGAARRTASVVGHSGEEGDSCVGGELVEMMAFPQQSSKLSVCLDKA